MSKYNEPEQAVINIIGSTTVISGDVVTNDDIRIDGSITGNIRSQSKVVIGASGKVKGEIVCHQADISGIAEAKITVTGLLMLRSTAKITGELRVAQIAVEPGAKFNGNCNLEETAVPQIRNIISKEKQKEEIFE